MFGQLGRDAMSEPRLMTTKKKQKKTVRKLRENSWLLRLALTLTIGAVEIHDDPQQVRVHGVLAGCVHGLQADIWRCH